MTSYREAGVDIDAGNRAVALLTDAVTSTATDAVLSNVGGFGGLYAADQLGPGQVLVASTDGVGTKVELAARYGRWAGVGADLVNHCVGDIIVQGARPLFFLDYIAMAELVPEIVAEIVGGMADACGQAGCALLGGETAEMPGVYTPGAVDIAGTIVGVADRHSMWPRLDEITAGDLLVGVPSSGPHTNGYSLIRKLLETNEPEPEMVDSLLQPHRSFLPVVQEMQSAGVDPLALAHITGGGFFENVPRVLPPALGARIELGSWAVPELFRTLVGWGTLPDSEAFRVWNMGIGLVVVVDPVSAERAQELGYSIVGEVTTSTTADVDRISLSGSWR